MALEGSIPENHEWYLEYQIHNNRPGLLGDIASILGMLQINIMTINGVDHNRRGMLLQCEDEKKIQVVCDLLEQANHVTVTKIRHPRLRDRMAVRHGRYIQRDADDKKIFRFVRDELGILVDFLAEILKRDGHQLVGIRGMPRVGKTESIVASSVCANKRWSFVSSTLLRQTVRDHLPKNEMTLDHVFIIDGIVSTLRATEQHRSLLREILLLPATKVIEHPDIFIRQNDYNITDFDYIIELRSHPDEEVSYDMIDANLLDFDF